MTELSPEDILAAARLTPRFEAVEQAREFYLSSPLPAFSGKTASDLVRLGHEDWLWRYIEAVDAGVHA